MPSKGYPGVDQGLEGCRPRGRRVPSKGYKGAEKGLSGFYLPGGFGIIIDGTKCHFPG